MWSMDMKRHWIDGSRPVGRRNCSRERKYGSDQVEAVKIKKGTYIWKHLRKSIRRTFWFIGMRIWVRRKRIDDSCVSDILGMRRWGRRKGRDNSHVIEILGVQEKFNGNATIELSIIKVSCSKYLPLFPSGWIIFHQLLTSTFVPWLALASEMGTEVIWPITKKNFVRVIARFCYVLFFLKHEVNNVSYQGYSFNLGPGWRQTLEHSLRESHPDLEHTCSMRQK